MLASTAWLNNLFRTKIGEKVEGVDLSTPLMYADRFRILHPGVKWPYFPPHIDGVWPFWVKRPMLTDGG